MHAPFNEPLSAPDLDADQIKSEYGSLFKKALKVWNDTPENRDKAVTLKALLIE